MTWQEIKQITGGVYIHDVGQIIINTIFPLKIFGVQIESVMTSSSSVVHCETNQILGKRGSGDACFLHPRSPCGSAEYRPSVTSSSMTTHLIIINGKLQTNTKKRYQCTHEGCDKAYSKPSRLVEHGRSHTGEVCHCKVQNYFSQTLPSVHTSVKCVINITCAKPICALTNEFTYQKHPGHSSVTRQDVQSASGQLST